MEYFIGIDIGTTSVKAVAFSREGYPLYELSVPCSTVHPFPGWSEQDPEDWFQKGAAGDENETQWIEGLLAERADARKRKDFATSDRIRDELAARGVIIEDGPQGARWKLASSTGAKHDECPA